MKKLVKNNVYWVCFIDWELEFFHRALQWGEITYRPVISLFIF
jgi:hypothetical protein